MFSSVLLVNVTHAHMHAEKMSLIHEFFSKKQLAPNIGGTKVIFFFK